MNVQIAAGSIPFQLFPSSAATKAKAVLVLAGHERKWEVMTDWIVVYTPYRDLPREGTLMIPFDQPPP